MCLKCSHAIAHHCTQHLYSASWGFQTPSYLLWESEDKIPSAHLQQRKRRLACSVSADQPFSGTISDIHVIVLGRLRGRSQWRVSRPHYVVCPDFTGCIPASCSGLTGHLPQKLSAFVSGNGATATGRFRLATRDVVRFKAAIKWE